MLKKQDLGINPHVANNSSRDQSLTGIGGPRVTLNILWLLMTAYDNLWQLMTLMTAYDSFWQLMT